MLQIAVPRYRCLTAECGRAVFNQDLGKLAAPRASTTLQADNALPRLHCRATRREWSLGTGLGGCGQ